MFLQPCRLNMEHDSKMILMNQFCIEKDLFSIFFELLIIQNTRVLLKCLTGQFKIFLTHTKDHQKDYYSLDDFICDFLLYYNDKIHSTTKFAPFKTIMNACDKELIEK